MNISEISIRRPVFAWMLMSALIIFGGISFVRLGVSQLPDVDFPNVSIGLSLDGAAPEVMEADVVIPVEESLLSISGITTMSSNVRSGSASITLEFDLDKNIDVAIQEVQTVLSRTVRSLPRNLDSPSVRKTNPEDQPIIWLAVTSESLSQIELMRLVRNQVKDAFSTISGVGEVFLGGYVDPALRVWLSNEKLKKYSLTVGDVLGTIESEHSEIPSGKLEAPDRELVIRTMGEAPSAEEFSRITINKRGGAPNFVPITLRQVAKVEDGLSDVRRITRSGGKPAVGLGIRKQRGSNAVEVAKLVKERMVALQKSLPNGVKIGVRFDTTAFIEESVQELNFTLLLSAILTALVCWIFLGSWSATLNIILAIPTSIVGTFIVLYAMGFTLNTFTLLALSLAIGIVVDDAIMVLENIVRHREMGKSQVDAALTGAREITFAALAATVAIIAIFLPVAFMQGVIGKFFFQFGITLSSAVALSLVEALTLAPMRCAQFLDSGERTTRIGKAVDAFFQQSSLLYKSLLERSLDHRWKTLLASLLFFVCTAYLGKVLKKEFVPAQDQSRMMVRLQTPVGTSLQVTDEKFREMEKMLSNQENVEEYFGSIGGMGGGDVNTGVIFVTLKPKDKRTVNPKTGNKFTQQELMDEVRKIGKNLKDVKVVVMDPSMSGFASRRGFPVEFTLKGPQWEILTEQARAVMAKMEESGIFSDVDSDFKEGLPEVRVFPDRNKARERGVSVFDIGSTINSMIGGTIAGKFTKDGKRYDVRVQLNPEERVSPANIHQLHVRNNRGELIPLSALTQIKETKSLQSINRAERERAVTIQANIAGKISQNEAMGEVEQITRNILPSGYRMEKSGSSKAMKESFESLIFAMILGLVVAYMVLASQFNHFVHPFTVLLALPFSISGAFVALYLGGQSLNLYSMIGIVLLMGIVKKNSILLVDYTNQLIESGVSLRTALLQACPVRLRPILMTSLSTVVGAIPPALAIGPGAESRIPMALAVIGGVLVSTVLTLFVVPCAYSVLKWNASVSSDS